MPRLRTAAPSTRGARTLCMIRALVVAFNKHIEEEPVAQMHYPAHDPAPAYGEPLALKACSKCHDSRCRPRPFVLKP